MGPSSASDVHHKVAKYVSAVGATGPALQPKSAGTSWSSAVVQFYCHQCTATVVSTRFRIFVEFTGLQ